MQKAHGILALLSLCSIAWTQPAPEVAQALPRSSPVLSPEGYPGLPRYPIHLTHTYPPQRAFFPGFFQVGYDDGALYLFSHLEQAIPPKAERQAEDPEWWRDDTLEVFLRTDPWNPEAPDLHLAVNARGTRFRAYTASLNYEAKAGLLDGGWWVALRLPFGQDLPRPRPGTFWQLKVGRGHPQAGEYTLWPLGGDFHSPGNYGYLFFAEKPERGEDLVQEVIRREAAAPPIASRLEGIRSWALYYGGDPGVFARLQDHDLVVLAREAPLAQVQGLRDRGVRVVSYLPLGFLPRREAEAKGLLPLALGPNPYAPDTLFMDPANPRWRAWVLEEAERLLLLGYAGFFLDGLDIADLHPETIPHLASLIGHLRSRLPDALLLQHRGFRVLRRTAEALDAVVYSHLSTDPVGRPFPGDPSPVWPFRRRGLVTLSLDITSDPNQARLAAQRARELGFLPFVTPSLVLPKPRP